MTKGKSNINAVFISHYHLDHIGLIDKINKDIPIYIESKSFEIHKLYLDFTNSHISDNNIKLFELKDKCIFSNDDIKVYAYLTDHSAYNSVMFKVEGDNKTILYTGDYRMHGVKKNVFIKNLKEISNVDLLISEGTNINRLGVSKSEDDIKEEINEVMKEYNQVLILRSSTNFDRLASLVKCSIKNNKKYILDLFSYNLNKITKMVDVDYKKIYVWNPKKYMKKSREFKEKYFSNGDIKGAFSKFSMDIKISMLEDIKLLYEKGLLNKCSLIYSMWEGYLENDDIKNFINELERMNIKIYNIHSSGHGGIEAYKVLNDIVKPKKAVIIHTNNKSRNIDYFDNVIYLNNNEYVDI